LNSKNDLFEMAFIFKNNNRFPIERIIGPYFEDGKCELELEAWKHPERPNHIGINFDQNL
jgi:hypothetical protein